MFECNGMYNAVLSLIDSWCELLDELGKVAFSCTEGIYCRFDFFFLIFFLTFMTKGNRERELSKKLCLVSDVCGDYLFLPFLILGAIAKGKELSFCSPWHSSCMAAWVI